MPQFTERFLQYAEKYHAKYTPPTIEVDWDGYTKNASNPDETARAVHIYTEHLVLSSAHVNDTDNAHKFVYSDSDVMRLYASGATYNFGEVKSRMQKWQGRWMEKNPCTGFTVQIKGTDEFAGNAIVIALEENKGVELACSLAKHWHHKGYAKEASGAVAFDWIKYLIDGDFHTPNGNAIENVVATVHPENKYSIKILESLGLECCGISEKYDAPRNYYKIAIVEPMGDSFDAEQGIS